MKLGFVIVSFLNFIDYFLVKFVNSKKGILSTAILGRLISSIAVTKNYESRSIESPELSKKYAASIIIASAISFPRLALLTYIFNSALFIYVAIPFAVFSIICLIVSLILIKEDTNKPNTNINLGNPMNLLNAIGFGVINVVIIFTVFYNNQYYGENGLYYSALIAGLTDTDVITISLAKFASDTEKIKLASSIIFTAVMSNMLVKLGIALFKGSKVTGKLVGYTFASIIVIGVLYTVIAY